MAPRRLLLLLAIALSVAGCAGSHSNPDWQEVGGVAIDEDSYVFFGFEAERAVTLDVSIRSRNGVPVDVLVMDDLNFQSYEQAGSFRHFEACGGLQTQSLDTSCNLGPGSYMVVLDNTNAGSDPAFDFVNSMASIDYDLRAF